MALNIKHAVACFIAFGVGCNSNVISQNNAMSENGSSETEWSSYGNDYANSRFSKLRSIDASNIGKLAPAYVFQSGHIGPFETTPLTKSGKLFFTTGDDEVFAIDARSGERIWSFTPKLGSTRLCCGHVNRGVAVGAGLVIIGQLDDKLVALDQGTGHLHWSTPVADPLRGYSITMAPLVYEDKVVVGVAGGEFGIRGFLSAYSLRDGHPLWRWYSTDSEHWAHHFSLRAADGSLLHRDLSYERSSFSRHADAWKRGGGAIWMTPALDERRKALYFSTGNPWPDYAADFRPGDNLMTDSIISLNAETGKLLWYFQEVPHDSFDWDAASPVFLLNTTDANGRSVAAVAEAGKTGWMYVLNRHTGRLIRRSQNFVPQSNMFALHSISRREVEPGSGGGSNWSPTSFSADVNVAVVTAIADHEQSLPATKMLRNDKHDQMPTHAGVAAGINMTTGRVIWEHRYDNPLVGGSVSTAGGVTFLGESSGYFDALETRTGKSLWQFNTGAGVNAAPIVFEVNGEERVAVAAGGDALVNSSLGDALFVFHLVH